MWNDLCFSAALFLVILFLGCLFLEFYGPFGCLESVGKMLGLRRLEFLMDVVSFVVSLCFFFFFSRLFLLIHASIKAF